jgi:hypothetical protein
MDAPHFCNVDLEIESRSDLSGLLAELGRKVIVLASGPKRKGFHSLRLETAMQYDNPDTTICAFCSCLELLSQKSRRAWRAANKKVFDVGYEIVTPQRITQFSLRAKTLKRISDLGGVIGVTIYNHHKVERKDRAKPVSTNRDRD